MRTRPTRVWMRAAAVLLTAGLLAGCRNYVTITSQPSGASVLIDSAYRGKTPLTTVVTWWAYSKNNIVLDHPDYHRFSTALRRQPYYHYLLLDVLTPYFLGTLFNSVGPVPNQHFVLRRKTRAGQPHDPAAATAPPAPATPPASAPAPRGPPAPAPPPGPL